MKTQIDCYIDKATIGLPARERIDTAAELRVHLNSQVKKHMLEGHNKEEAEFLAVDAMGAVAPVNRQFLGHIFTPRVGWGLVVAAVFGVSSWLLWTNQELLFMAQGSITQVPENQVQDFAVVTGLQTKALDIVAPLGTKEITYALITPNKNPEISKVFTRNSRKIRLFISSDTNLEKCQRIFVGSNERRIDQKVCAPEPIATSLVGVSPWFGTEYLYPQNPSLNRWIPIFVMKPTVVEKRTNETWISFGNPQTRTWTALFIQFKDKTNGCWNCTPNWRYLKLVDETRNRDGVAPKMLLEQAQQEGIGFSDLIGFQIPQITKQIDAAIHRHGQKPLIFTNVVRPNTKTELIASFGVYNLQGNRPSSRHWNVSFGDSSSGEFVNAAENYPEVFAPEYAVPDKAIDPNIGDNSLYLTLPKRFSLDTWIPIWALPTHVPDTGQPRGNSGNRSIGDVHLDPNKWYIGYVRFLSKPSDGRNIFPRYKVKSPENPRISLLEVER